MKVLYINHVLATSGRKGPFTYLSVLGGIDSSLTHLTHIHKPTRERSIETAILTDVNEYAIEYGQFRLDLLSICEDPQDYLRSIIPARTLRAFATDTSFIRDITGLEDQTNLESYKKVYEALIDMRFEYDDSYLKEKMSQLGYSHGKQSSIVRSVTLPLSSGFHKHSRGEEMIMPQDISLLLAQALTRDDHWLSLKRPENYKTIAALHEQNSIRLIRMPLQSLGNSPLGEALLSKKMAPLGYLNASNVGAIMGDGDFSFFMKAVATIEETQQQSVDLIYGVSGAGGLFQIKQRIATESKAFRDPALRTQTKTKLPDIIR